MKQFNHKSTLLAIAMCAMCTNMNAQAWDGTSAECTKGDGSKANPYLIENPQNLAWLAEQVNGGNIFIDAQGCVTYPIDLSSRYDGIIHTQ